MKMFLKHLRARYLSDAAITALSPIGSACGKASVVAQSCMEEDNDDDDESIVTGRAGSSSQAGFTSSSVTGGSSSLRAGFASSSSTSDELGRTGHPNEPCEIDHPIRCPHPEPGIMQDGWALKERRRPSIKRTGKLPYLSKSKAERRRQSCHSFPDNN